MVIRLKTLAASFRMKDVDQDGNKDADQDETVTTTGNDI